MRVFYHVVGRDNAKRDFPQTVFRRRPVGLVESSLGAEHPVTAPLLADLTREFPTGDFNAWGVPAGAEKAMADLVPGDVVLLVDTVGAGGGVRAICRVKVFPNLQLPQLSEALWGDARFPYIFFFDTESVTIPWPEFKSVVGYEEKYRAPALVLTIHPRRMQVWGGPEGFVSELSSRFGQASAAYPVSQRAYRSVVRQPRAVYGEPEVAAFEDISRISRLPEPVLTSSPRERVEVLTTPRSSTFRSGIVDLYSGRCAVCASGLRTPAGLFEVEGAHIYPRRLDGSDDWRNGICLCRRHHWAFDAGWFAVTDDLRVVVRADLPDDPQYDFIRRCAARPVAVPVRIEFAPHPLFLRAHRLLHGLEPS